MPDAPHGTSDGATSDEVTAASAPADSPPSAEPPPAIPRQGDQPVSAREQPVGSARSALFWTYALTIARFTTTGVVTIVMASYLQPRAYGVMALAMVWVVFAQALAQHGPAQAVVQRDQVTDRHHDAAFWSTLAGSVLLAVIFAAVAPLWATVNGAPELITVCWALAPAIVLNAFVLVPDAVLRRQMQFKRLSIRIMVASLISGVVGIAAAVAGYGVWALVIQQLLLSGISAVVVSAVAPWRPRLRSFGHELRDIRGFSLHSVSVYLAYFASTRMDSIMLGAFFGPVAIGLYRFSVRITDMITDVSAGGLGQISLPHLSRFSVDRAEFARQLGKVLHAGAVLSVPLFGILFPCADEVVAFLGPQWVTAGPALRALCLAGMGGVLGTILAPAIQAVGRPGVSAAIGWVKAGVTAVALATVGILERGATPQVQVLTMAVTFGIIHVSFGAFGVVVVFRWILRLPIGPAVRPAVPALLSGVVAAALGWATQPLTAGLAPLAGLLVTGSVSGLGAAAVLLWLDAEVSATSRRIVRRLRPAPQRA